MFTSDILNKPGTEESVESLKTTEATETTTNLDSRETRGDPGLGNQTTSSPGRFVQLGFHLKNMSA